MTPVDVCNMALDAIGTRSTIASLTEASPEAAAVSRHYDNARRAVLRACHWNFARKQAPLSLLLDSTQGQTVPVPWAYEYAYPQDCLLARYVMPIFQAADNASVPGASVLPVVPAWLGPPVRWLMAQDLDPNGTPINVVLTDQPQAVMVYTVDTPSTALWDDLFTDALANYLGARICPALTGDKDQQKIVFEIARQKVAQANAINGNEGIRVQEIQPDWLRVRGYASDWAWPEGPMFIGQPQQLTLVG